MHANSPATKPFEQLMDVYAPALRRLCTAHRRDIGDQQDLFQEIAIALWTALPRFRGDSSQRTWLYRIAHNVALTDSFRRQRKRRKEVPFTTAPPLATAANSRGSTWKA